MINIVQLKDFPECPLRKGRVDPVTKEAYMSCGFTEIEPKECIKCGGIRNTHLTAEPKQKYQRL